MRNNKAVFALCSLICFQPSCGTGDGKEKSGLIAIVRNNRLKTAAFQSIKPKGNNLVGQEMIRLTEHALNLDDASPLTWRTNSQSMLRDGSILSSEQLFYNNILVEGVQVKNLLEPSGEISTTGSIPQFVLAKGNLSQINIIEKFSLAAQEVRALAASALGYNEARWSGGEARYFAAKHYLLPAWLFVVSAEQATELGQGPAVPHQILVSAVDGAILVDRSLAFEIDGTATLYRENAVVSQAMESIALPNLSGDGTYLSSDLFSVLNCDINGTSTVPSSSCQQFMTSTNGVFPVIATPLTDKRYDELVAYHAISWAYDWNKSLATQSPIESTQRRDAWGDLHATVGLSTSHRLTVFVRALAGASPTKYNAQYLPYQITGTGAPIIAIGTGWEPGATDANDYQLHNLRYLSKDADVFIHEFGHHVIFRSVLSTVGESSVIHEGTADYFTYAMTGNSKLGESIVDSTVVKGGLRSGNITGKISDFTIDPEKANYNVAEFWSSTLLEVRQALGPWQQGLYKADKIIWDAIDLATESEKLYAFIANMAKAADIFARTTGDNAVDLRVKMFTVFANRGFIEQPNATGDLPAATASIYNSIDPDVTPVPVTPSPTRAPTASPTSAPARAPAGKTSTRSGWCSVVASGNNQQKIPLWLCISLLFCGMVSPLFRKFRC